MPQGEVGKAHHRPRKTHSLSNQLQEVQGLSRHHGGHFLVVLGAVRHVMEEVGVMYYMTY